MPLIRRRQDYAYWLNLFKMNKNIKCLVVDQVLGGYLRNEGSLSSSRMQNAKSNFTMFRHTMGYGRIQSATLLLLNIAIRLARL